MSTKVLDGLLRQGEALITKLCRGDAVEEVRRVAMERHAALEETAPKFKKKINRDNFTYGTPGLALYQALRSETELT